MAIVRQEMTLLGQVLPELVTPLCHVSQRLQSKVFEYQSLSATPDWPLRNLLVSIDSRM